MDFGQIETKTFLIQKLKGFDYKTAEDENILYDVTHIKFGQIRFSLDYNLDFVDISDTNEPAFRLSRDCLKLTSQFNFGFEVKTCLHPFHEVFPAQVVNLKMEELKLYVS